MNSEREAGGSSACAAPPISITANILVSVRIYFFRLGAGRFFTGFFAALVFGSVLVLGLARAFTPAFALTGFFFAGDFFAAAFFAAGLFDAAAATGAAVVSLPRNCSMMAGFSSVDRS